MSLVIDRTSLLVEVEGEMPLGTLERALDAEGLTLDVSPDVLQRALTVSRWLALGAPGTRELLRDPSDHLLAGALATFVGGHSLVVHPAPRRAVGPDLLTFLLGGNERFGTIERAWLRVHPRGLRRHEASPFAETREPPVSDDEHALLERLAAELGSPPRAGS